MPASQRGQRESDIASQYPQRNTASSLLQVTRIHHTGLGYIQLPSCTNAIESISIEENQ